ncbi:hypothetical protein VNO77_27978 [Canavalia gladiata]|uniref:Uncharacterized protein n=1 Tax=Canavalia gladiata TaxID=3824 RepID=A0AAN9QB09_CANGL
MLLMRKDVTDEVWSFTTLYGWPEEQNKRQTLALMKNEAIKATPHWMVFWHLNVIANFSEKKGGKVKHLAFCFLALITVLLSYISLRKAGIIFSNAIRRSGYSDMKNDEIKIMDVKNKFNLYGMYEITSSIKMNYIGVKGQVQFGFRMRIATLNISIKRHLIGGRLIKSQEFTAKMVLALVPKPLSQSYFFAEQRERVSHFQDLPRTELVPALLGGEKKGRDF